MKREIKFRVWDHNTNTMMIPDYFEFYDGKIGWIEAGREAGPESGNDGCPDQFEIMQYTGLHDKNGQEVYEGDIVRWGDMVGLGHEKPVRVAVVRFDPDICFDSNVGIFDYGNFVYKETDKYLTVIGNVFENHELLEAAKHE